ncbi:MFS transporter [candidate division KSB1 bacterium]|nr:MFS transporter [candidate division KSB1 bacterium]
MMDDSNKKPAKKAVVSWILYDFANTAYSMNVVSLYFGTWLIIDLGQSDFVFSLSNSISMILVALTMPLLGDWSDWRGTKLKPLLWFTLACIMGTAAMGGVGKLVSLPWLIVAMAMTFFVIANYSYQGGLVFYNALLPAVSTRRTLGRVSGYGVAMGYVGAVVGLLVAQVFVEGEIFSFSIPGIQAGGTVASFIPTAGLFLLFALPTFFFVNEPEVKARYTEKWTVSKSYQKILSSLKDTQKYPGLLRFLVAKLLYEDSIQTIILFMGVYTQEVMGFTRGQANVFLMFEVPFAVIGSALCGILTDHYGPKKTLQWVIGGWIICLSIVVTTSHTVIFWIVGAFVGALMGSTWTSARPLLISLVPREMLGEFFGLYSLSGKVAAITGPLIWSLTTWTFASMGTVVKYKMAVLALVLIMIVGFFILRPVPDFHRKNIQS